MIATATLGRSGAALTRLGLGTWAIGGPWRFGWGPVDDAESIAAIRRAIEEGINWVDTAAVYGIGHAEEMVGRALQGYTTGGEVFVCRSAAARPTRTAPRMAICGRSRSSTNARRACVAWAS